MIGKYWGSAEHRKEIAEEKKEVLAHIKILAEKQLIDPTETRKIIIDEQYEYYKRLTEYNFSNPKYENCI